MAELQAATRLGLATLYRGTPREQASLQQLRDVYNSFTEGHDTVQLVAARTASTHSRCDGPAQASLVWWAAYGLVAFGR